MRRLGLVMILAPLAALACGDDTGEGGGGTGGDDTTSSTSSKSTTTSSSTTASTSTTATSSSGGMMCGNGMIDGNEECDGTNLDGADCVSEGFLGGDLACNNNCTFDTSGCFNENCGNDMVEGMEVCDGTDLAMEDCISQGFDSGTLACAGNCAAFDTAGCVNFSCGDMMINGTEECDGTMLGGEDCVSQGFDAGTLACAAGTCLFDTSGCLTEQCVDGIDNDGDTDIDCADASCAAECADACDTVPSIADPSTNTGDTTAHADLYTSECSASSGPEVVYQVVASQTGFLHLTLTSDADLGVSAWTGCPSSGTEESCEDLAFGVAGVETTSMPVTTGQVVHVMVDGFGNTSAGPFTLDVETVTAAVCGDGFVDGAETCDDGNTDDFDGCNSTCTNACDDGVCGPGEDSCSCSEDCVDDPNTCSSCECGDSGGAGDLCWCDAACVGNGDCCANVATACGQTITLTSTAGVAITDNAYNGTLASMSCVQLPATATGAVFSVNSVTYSGDHTWIGDLVAKLLSPAAQTTVTLFSRPGVAETADDGNDTAGFGDSANLVSSSPITYSQTAGPASETMGAFNNDTALNLCAGDNICAYQPSPGAAAPGNLTSFTGDDVNGTWQLCVGDSGFSDTGDIDTVSVNVTIIP